MKTLCGSLSASVVMALALSLPAVTAEGAAMDSRVLRGTALPADGTPRSIRLVEEVNVDAPMGTAPRLPYRLLVTYSDGASEYRQVRWTNSGAITEAKQASSSHAVGDSYQVRGFILGDNTTGNGYPVVARVKVVDKAWSAPAAKPKAEPLPLNAVTLLGNNRLTSNRDLDIDQLLSLDVSQQLYNYRDTYDMPTEGYTLSNGWDSPKTKLKGHGSGHYMSAMAFAYASCTDPQKKARLLANIKRMVDELRACQERTFVYDEKLGRYREARDLAPEAELRELKGDWASFDVYKKDYKNYGYGYLNAIPAQHCALIEMYRAYNNESWVWAPYYSVHKQLAGLIDIANYVEDKQVAAKALLIAKDMGLWVWNRMHYRTYVKSDGSQSERRAKPGNRYEMWNMYIAGEVGGMAESLSRLAEMTSDPTEKAHLIEAAGAFDSPAFFDPLARNEDAIRTRHANQHIPMIVGALRSYRSNANPYYYNLSLNFWNFIQGRYRYAMGGVGNGEMFRQPYTQMLSMNTNSSSWGGGRARPEPNINETCCAYNLAKLTKDLFAYDPDNAAYMDYYERTLYNQIVGSVNPHDYGVCYQYAVGLNASKPFGNETPQSTCCGGTGVENHVKYQEATYFVDEQAIYVNLYMPTEACWDAKKVVIRQDCKWPAEKSVIRIVKGGRFAMKLRVPYWATSGFDIKLNGRSVATMYAPSSYVEIPERKWSTKDVVEVTMPFTSHVDFGPDKMQLAVVGGEEGRKNFTPQWVGALMYGPLVMSTTGISSWEEAEADLKADLSNVKLLGATPDEGTDGNLYRLSFAGREFIPDYAANRNATHYLRLDVESDPAAKMSEEVQELLADAGVDKADLTELMQDARARRDAQYAWNAMTVKVPEYAPWAPHGFTRLMAQYDQCNEILNSQDPDLTQEMVDNAAAALNAALNTMRPGNLPELEDLNTLQPLLRQVRRSDAAATDAGKQAIAYAEMVISYVSDGSGTADMIDNAVKQLEALAK